MGGPGRGRPAGSLRICSSQVGSWGNLAVPCSLELSTSSCNELSDTYLKNSASCHTRNKVERPQEETRTDPRHPCPVIGIVYCTKSCSLSALPRFHSHFHFLWFYSSYFNDAKPSSGEREGRRTPLCVFPWVAECEA